MKSFILSFLFLLVNLSQVKAQWELRYPALPEDKITDITFLSESTGFFVNEAGAIYKTSDTGESWNKVFYDGNSRFTNIQFIDDQVGFAYAYIGSCFTYTLDGGETWTQDDLNVHLAEDVIGFSPSEFLKTDENGIYKTTSVFGNWQKVYEVPTETIDGGDLYWEETIAIPKTLHQFSDSSLSILYYNRYRGNYLAKTDSLYYLLKSNNRGASWDSVWINVQGTITSFTMVDKQTGFLLTEDGEFYTTDNSAVNWQQRRIPSTEVNSHTIVAFSRDRIYLKGREVLKTIDGGNNWEVIQVPQNGFNTGYVVSRYNHSTIQDLQLKITDEGEEWVHGKQFPRIGGSRIYFKDKNTGWTYNQGHPYITTDGGYSWKPDTTFPEYPKEIQYLSDNTGWMMGKDNIYYTENSGETWTAQNLIDTEESLYNGHILFENSFGIIYANVNCDNLACGNLLVTTNTGSTWDSAQVPVYFESLSVSNGNIFGVGDDKKLWTSTDKGKNWEVIYNFTNQNLYPRPLVRSIGNMIWLNIGSGSLAYSRDGGETWGTTSVPADEDMALIGPFSRGNYYVYVPDHGNVLRIDSELNVYDKRDQQLPTDVGIEDISYVLDENNVPHIWIKGWYNTVLYLKGPIRVQVSNEKNEIEIPATTNLYQNYPNPFNPSTTISFELSRPGEIRLSVYNMIGQEVALLQNNRLAAGKHSLDFNADKLSSGTYIYRLETEEGAYIKTFTLIK